MSVIERVRYRQVELHWNAHIFARTGSFCLLREVFVIYRCPLKNMENLNAIPVVTYIYKLNKLICIFYFYYYYIDYIDCGIIMIGGIGGVKK